MLNEIRTVYLDSKLEIEAYRFKGIMQKFPAHFHEYYVIGFIEEGQRHLVCRGEEYIINPGDLLLFNPFDAHSCEQLDGKTLDYRCINVNPKVMEKVVLEINSKKGLPRFTQSVLFQSLHVPNLKELHLKISQNGDELEKEELFIYLLDELIQAYSDLTILPYSTEGSYEIKTICSYLEANYMKTITLNELSTLVGWSKYHLLRSFTKERGISPYSYLVSIRINQAKELLEQKIKPIEVAFLTGFSDQSHLTKFFKGLVGLTPKQYMSIYDHEEEKCE